MTDTKPLMLVFAGPNGSGKSTVTREQQKAIEFPLLYINADEIAREQNIGAYEAAVEADRQRRNAIENRESFSMETVMSTPEKIDLMREAKNKGYEVELVYVTTQNPEINLDRVKIRVLKGEHDVPEDKILSRYDRSMKLLPEAFKTADLVEIYNNSFEDPVLIAEKTKNREIMIYPQPAPSKWSEQTIKKLIGVESAKVITPEHIRDAIRPSRAVAFEQLPEAEAIKEHPDLAEAYKTMHAAAQYFETKIPGNTTAQRDALLGVKKRVQIRLDEGKTRDFRTTPSEKQGDRTILDKGDKIIEHTEKDSGYDR